MNIIRGDQTGIVPNFANGEFFTHSEDFNADSHYFNEKLVFAAQAVRDFIGSSVTVNSTYRTYLGNKNSGGAVGSLHLKGEAEDLQTGSHTAKIQADIENKGVLYQKLRSLGIGGFGIGTSFIHLDTRTSGNQKDFNRGNFGLWYYAGVKKNSSSPVSDLVTSTVETTENEVAASPSNKKFYLIGGAVLLLILLMSGNARNVK